MHILNSYTLARFSNLLILEGLSRISQFKLWESPLKPAAYILKSTLNCSPYCFILMYIPYSHCPQFQFLFFAPFPFCGLWVKLVCPLTRQGFQPPGCSASPVLHLLSAQSVSFFHLFLQRQLPRATHGISHEVSPEHLLSSTATMLPSSLERVVLTPHPTCTSCDSLQHSGFHLLGTLRLQFIAKMFVIS